MYTQSVGILWESNVWVMFLSQSNSQEQITEIVLTFLMQDAYLLLVLCLSFYVSSLIHIFLIKWKEKFKSC